MANVVLGPVGSFVTVDLRVCAKTGKVTDERVILSGRTRPSWVTVLLVVSVIGFLFADAMTSQRSRVDLPLSHAVVDRWRRGRRLAGVVGLVGAASLVAAATGTEHAGWWVGLGTLSLAIGCAVGTVNAQRNQVGLTRSRRDELVLTRVHGAFLAAVEGAAVERVAR